MEIRLDTSFELSALKQLKTKVLNRHSVLARKGQEFIFFEFTPEGKLHISATDGHKAFRYSTGFTFVTSETSIVNTLLAPVVVPISLTQNFESMLVKTILIEVHANRDNATLLTFHGLKGKNAVNQCMLSGLDTSFYSILCKLFDRYTGVSEDTPNTAGKQGLDYVNVGNMLEFYRSLATWKDRQFKLNYAASTGDPITVTQGDFFALFAPIRMGK
jgi:hypothetical protein